MVRLPNNPERHKMHIGPHGAFVSSRRVDQISSTPLQDRSTLINMYRRISLQYPDPATRPRHPCLICSLLNIQCDVTWSSTGCRNCAHELYTCMSVGTTTMGLTDAFEPALQLDHTEWMFPHDEGATILTIDNSPLGQEIIEDHSFLDLAQMQGYDSHPKDTRLRFLNQFCTLTSRWGNYYERLTETVLERAAQYQQILCLSEEDGLDPDEKFLVLNALRCLHFSVVLSSIEGYISGKFDDFGDDHTILADAELNQRGGDRAHAESLIETRYQFWDLLDPKYRHPRIDESAKFCSVIGSTFKGAESLMLRRQPKDWPAIFYALYILQLVYWDVSRCNNFTDGMHGAVKFIETRLHTLARLYFICAGNGLQPMSLCFDSQWCSILLGLSVQNEHYQELHRLWMENREEGDVVNNGDDFLSQLDRFSFGFAV